MNPGEFTLAEILSQPEAWQAGLSVTRDSAASFSAIFQREAYDQVLITGCGSTYYISIAAAALLTQLTGRPARALPASEIWFHPDLAYAGCPRTLLVAISRSGETSETLHACQAFLESGRGPLVTITCYPDCALSTMGELNLVLPSGMEDSVAQTRSFSTMYLAWTALVAGTVGPTAQLDRLPAAARRLLDRYAPLAETLGADPSIDRFYFLGSGIRYGLACELSLKMKEMSLSHSEPFHFMEFRHGPKSMITPGTLIVGLRSESDRAHETAVLEEMAAMGARLLVIDEVEFASPAAGVHSVAMGSGVDEALRGALYLPVAQLMACRHALAKGVNPDAPANLTAVIRLG